MKVEIEIKNYRCFDLQSPAKFILAEGFTSFVGVNNSGKSAILKFFYEFRNFFNDLSDKSTFRNILNNKYRLNIFNSNNILKDISTVFNHNNEHGIELSFKFETVKLKFKIERDYTVSTEVLTVPQKYSYPTKENARYLAEYDKFRSSFLFKEPSGEVFETSISDVQIFFKDLANSVYIPAFRNIVNLGGVNSYYDINIGSEFIKQWKILKNGSSNSQILSTTRVEASIKRIFEFKSLQINAADDGSDLILIIDERVVRLSELGSGISQFILVLVNIFLSRPTYIFIDEPEVNLHPSLQIEFLSTIAEYTKYGVLFTTHSLGLARNMSSYIYYITRKFNDEISYSELRLFDDKAVNLSQLLGELSYSTYKEIGANKILLVEGPTEVTTFQQILRKFKKDQNVVIMNLGGSSMINGNRKRELEELKRIVERIDVVIDSEKESENDNLSSERKNFIDICTELGYKTLVLKRRAIENYLSEGAIRLVKGDNFRMLLPYEKLGVEKEVAWGKDENWRIALKMSKTDFEGTDLGNFLIEL